MVQPEEVTAPPVSARAAAEPPIEYGRVRQDRASVIANVAAGVALLAILAMGIAYVNAGMP